MAAKGTQSKASATEKILNIFEGSFCYDKEIRIPFIENGEEIQLKCILTCAKTNVLPNGDIALPGEKTNEINFGEDSSAQSEKQIIEPTQEEKENIARLVQIFNL